VFIYRFYYEPKTSDFRLQKRWQLSDLFWAFPQRFSVWVCWLRAADRMSYYEACGVGRSSSVESIETLDVFAGMRGGRPNTGKDVGAVAR